MDLVLNAIQQRAALFPNQTAIISGAEKRITSNQNLLDEITLVENFLKVQQVSRLGIYMDNCAEWIVFDLAAARLNIVVIPIPLFFSKDQIDHVLISAEIDAVISLSVVNTFFKTENHQTVDTPFSNVFLNKRASLLDYTPKNTLADVAKVTFTSGSTGNPKGVCLSKENINATCTSLETAMAQSINFDDVNHLCVMPLATLLENIAGVYLCLIRGGTVVTEPLQSLGFTSNVSFDCQKLLHKFKEHQIGSAILFPQILENLVNSPTEQVLEISQCLQFIAVGGGSISTKVLQQAEKLNLPIFQGYGLSECCSVVSLNLPNQNKTGSVGKPLEHVDISIDDDGEIIIHGQAMMGYLGELENEKQAIHTGDLGYFDAQGYLHVQGRKKNTLVSSFGRNISPEWVESILTAQAEISQAAVFGDSQAELSAVIVANEAFSHSLINRLERVIAQCNKTLPDYARIGHWVLSEAPFSPRNNTLTHNGRLKRAHIADVFQHELSALTSTLTN